MNTPEWLEAIKQRAAFLEHQEYRAKATLIEAENQLIDDGYYLPIAALYANSQCDIPALLQLVEKQREALENAVAKCGIHTFVSRATCGCLKVSELQEALNFRPEGVEP